MTRSGEGGSHVGKYFMYSARCSGDVPLWSAAVQVRRLLSGRAGQRTEALSYGGTAIRYRHRADFRPFGFADPDGALYANGDGERNACFCMGSVIFIGSYTDRRYIRYLKRTDMHDLPPMDAEHYRSYGYLMHGFCIWPIGGLVMLIGILMVAASL